MIYSRDQTRIARCQHAVRSYVLAKRVLAQGEKLKALRDDERIWLLEMSNTLENRRYQSGFGAYPQMATADIPIAVHRLTAALDRCWAAQENYRKWYEMYGKLAEED